MGLDDPWVEHSFEWTAGKHIGPGSNTHTRDLAFFGVSGLQPGENRALMCDLLTPGPESADGSQCATGLSCAPDGIWYLMIVGTAGFRHARNNILNEIALSVQQTFCAPHCIFIVMILSVQQAW